MIEALRTRHRRSWAVLALILPLGIALGLSVRRSIPIAPELALAGQGNSAEPIEQVALGALWNDLPIATRLMRDEADTWLELRAESDLQEPDLLVYFAPHASSDSGLPESARLLGSLGGTQPRRYRIPSEPQAASVYLYSLAHQELVGACDLPLSEL